MKAKMMICTAAVFLVTMIPVQAQQIIGNPNAAVNNGYFRIQSTLPQFQFGDTDSPTPYDLGLFQFDGNDFRYKLYQNSLGKSTTMMEIEPNGRTTFYGAMRCTSSGPSFEFIDQTNTVDPLGAVGYFQFINSTFQYRLYRQSTQKATTLWALDPQGATNFYGNLGTTGAINAAGNIVTTAGKVGIGTASPTTALHVVGETTTNVINITGGSDLAEQFQVSNDVKPGTVVCIDAEHPGQLKASTKAYDKTVAGVISGAGGLQTGMKMGQQGSIADGSHPVALSGRVYCNVDATKGAVRPGDLLTTSNTPGCAMVVKDHAKAQGAVIGKAMTSLKAGQKGLVLVLISLQ